MAQVGWVDPAPTADLEYLAEVWPASQQLEDATLADMLRAGYVACAAWAPPMPLVDGVPTVPAEWKLAQIMHAKHVWARFRTGNAETVGPDGYTISTYPLVLEARSILRPVQPGFKGLL